MKITNQSTLTSKITLPDATEEEVTTKSNESTTEYMTDSFLKVKASNKTYAKKGDEVDYTITLTNNSEYDIFDVSLIDTISTGATFKAGSVKINDTPYADYDPTVGFELPSQIATLTHATITYTVTINNDITASDVTNTAKITYSVNEVTDLEENTNTVDVQIVNNTLTITKTSDKSAVIKGQTLSYSITIKNDGNMTNTNLVFTDPLPSGVTFVAGSVKVNDVSQPSADPNVGFSLDDLDPTEQIVVTFDVTVN